ncbi:hypothetical protein [Clostridium uliginosum]|nr:hypothetical protein [Clostridium uliginosum]
MDLAVDISSVEVVPFIACPNFILGACINGATSTVGNSQVNPQ